jgi:hypothetical protein
MAGWWFQSQNKMPEPRLGCSWREVLAEVEVWACGGPERRLWRSLEPPEGGGALQVETSEVVLGLQRSGVHRTKSAEPRAGQPRPDSSLRLGKAWRCRHRSCAPAGEPEVVIDFHSPRVSASALCTRARNPCASAPQPAVTARSKPILSDRQGYKRSSIKLPRTPRLGRNRFCAGRREILL